MKESYLNFRNENMLEDKSPSCFILPSSCLIFEFYWGVTYITMKEKEI